MRGEHHAAVAARIAQRRLHQPRRLGVERRRGLVEEEHRGVADERARDGHALLLPARERRAVLAEHRLIALGQLRDEVVAVGEPGGGLDLG